MCAAVGADADDDRIELLLSQVKGKDITELIAAGREKLASVPAGGGGGGVAVAASAGGAAAAPAAEEKKEEKKVEEKEESDDVSLIFQEPWLFSAVDNISCISTNMVVLFSILQDMGFSLFD